MTTIHAGMTPAGATPRRPELELTTPALLRLMLGGIWALSAVFVLVAGVGVDRHRQAVKSIGRDAGPSVIAAQHIRTSLARAHVDAIGMLKGSSASAYDADRREAADELVAAAENITYGNAERDPIRRLVDGYGRYGAAVARARAAAGPGSAEAFAEADRLLHRSLLPDADALDRVNRDALERAYLADRADAGWGLAWTIVAGLGLLAAVGGTHAFVTWRTRRALNPGLVVAGCVTATALAGVVAGMAASAGDLRVAKADAFDSVVALWQARSVAVDGHAARLGGLDPRRVADTAAELATPPGGMSLDDVVAALGRGATCPNFHGLLADEVRNVTFPGEQEAAMDTLRAYATYAADGSSASFGRFDSALGQALDVNQVAYDADVARGLADLDSLWTWTAAAAVVVCGSTFLGVRPRLREYAA